MMRRITLLAVGALVAALMLTAGTSANNRTTPPGQFLGLYQVSGPYDSAHLNQKFRYELGYGNGKPTAVKSMQLDVFLRGQRVDSKSLQLSLSAHTTKASQLIAGGHVRLVLRNVPAHAGGSIVFFAKMVGKVNHTYCNLFQVRYKGAVVSFPHKPCITVSPGV
jgi:hypothetical protein